MTDYNNTLNDFIIGDRVELHPACDLWMRGARFGNVVKIGRKKVTVFVDHPAVRRDLPFSPDLLRVRARNGFIL